MHPIKIHHVAIVVEDVQTALDFWQRALGLSLERTEHNDEEAVDAAFLTLDGCEIELVAPTTTDSGVARYMAKRGPGLHHVCIEVDDLNASLKRISDAGAELINAEPRMRADGIRYAFVHPRSTGGVLLELYELPKS